MQTVLAAAFTGPHLHLLTIADAQIRTCDTLPCFYIMSVRCVVVVGPRYFAADWE